MLFIRFNKILLKKGAALKTSKSKKRLLVIDDDPTVLFAVRKLLLYKNIDIDTSESLDEAIGFIDKFTYHMIITDLTFSETVDNAGLAISHYARKKNPKVAIVLWTAKDISELSETISCEDIDLCLPKPIAPNVINSVVEQISAHRSNHRGNFKHNHQIGRYFSNRFISISEVRNDSVDSAP